MWILTAILLGLAAGIAHVATGPDHLAAVAPLAMDAQARSWRPGLMWGIGHSTGTWVLAAIAVVFRESMRVDLISAWSERLVGVVLIGVGIWAFQRALSGRVHSHEHTHDGVAHRHIHVHARGDCDAAPHGEHAHGALGIGVLHGFAGTAHLLGILPALALPTRAGAVIYVSAFGIGSIAAMAVLSAAIGLLAARPAFGRAFHGIMMGSAACAIGLGVFWVLDSTQS